MRKKLASLILAPLLLLSSFQSLANSYYIVVPIPGRAESGGPVNPGTSPLPNPPSEVDPEDIEISLQPHGAFSAQSGFTFNFDFMSILSVSGAPDFRSSDVTFSVGTADIPSSHFYQVGLPSGIGMSGSTLAGTPTVQWLDTYHFNVNATYRGKSTSQRYELMVQQAPTLEAMNASIYAKVGDEVHFNLASSVHVADYGASGTLEFEVRNLPPGLTFDGHMFITGRITAPGDYSIQITAKYRGLSVTYDVPVELSQVQLSLDSRIELVDAQYEDIFGGYYYYVNVAPYAQVTGDSGSGEFHWSFDTPNSMFALHHTGDMMNATFDNMTPGVYEFPATVTYTASDGYEYRSSTVFVINVQPPP